MRAVPTWVDKVLDREKVEQWYQSQCFNEINYYVPLICYLHTFEIRNLQLVPHTHTNQPNNHLFFGTDGGKGGDRFS